METVLPRAISGVDDVRTCRTCGCTDENCSGCIERTGEACHWVSDDLCSACDVEHSDPVDDEPGLPSCPVCGLIDCECATPPPAGENMEVSDEL